MFYVRTVTVEDGTDFAGEYVFASLDGNEWMPLKHRPQVGQEDDFAKLLEPHGNFLPMSFGNGAFRWFMDAGHVVSPVEEVK